MSQATYLWGRRELLAISVMTMASTGGRPAVLGGQMYGLIGKATAVSGKRDELLAILLEGVASMPGCLSYVVAKDPKDPDVIWITEVWDTQASHDASLTLPSVKAAIAKARPLMAGFGDPVITIPVGGHGLAVPA
jgi:quinol monooxygenase YgiN